MQQQQLSSGLENWGDDLLVEILSRLPNGETAAQCKLVSKRWKSLLSDPYFISRLISHYQHHQEEAKEEDYALLVGVSNPGIYAIGDLVSAVYAFPLDGNPRAEKFFSPRFSFSSFIPLHVLGCNFGIKASCGDLLLCGQIPFIAYVVCNPITRQWIALPPPPPRPTPNFVNTCAILREGEETFAINIRFRVLIFCFDYKNRSELYLDIYYSETGLWHRSHPLDFHLYAPDYSTIVAYKGELHWFNHDRNLVACDPLNTCFNTCPLFRIINSGSELKKYSNLASPARQFRLGVCGGILRVMWLDQDCTKLRLFDLKDYDFGQWTFNCEESTRTLLSSNPNLNLRNDWGAYDVAFHPTNPAVVFLGIWGAVVKCNLRKKQVQVLARLPNEFCYFSRGCCTLLIPRWPTPIYNFVPPRAVSVFSLQ